MISNHTAHWVQLIRPAFIDAQALEPLDDQRGTHGWNEIIHSLTQIGKFAELINKAISIQLAAHIFSEVLIYPVNIVWVFRPGNILNLVFICIQLVRFSALLLMAASLKAKVRQCVEFIYIETYWREGWKDNFPNEMIAFTLKKIGVKFPPGYDVDHAFIGLVSITHRKYTNTRHCIPTFRH